MQNNEEEFNNLEYLFKKINNKKELIDELQNSKFDTKPIIASIGVTGFLFSSGFYSVFRLADLISTKSALIGTGAIVGIFGIVGVCTYIDMLVENDNIDEKIKEEEKQLEMLNRVYNKQKDDILNNKEISFNEFTCPCCNAPLNVNESSESISCEYCDTKFYLNTFYKEDKDIVLIRKR
ncbi:MAG: hypothetical protein IJ572_03415 [Bacilli bacterium]|nr:hypothetical protein [Bacilli bacterium]